MATERLESPMPIHIHIHKVDVTGNMVPSQSEAENVTNQAEGQTSSQSDDNKQMVERENVVKTRSCRVVRKPARFRDNDT